MPYVFAGYWYDVDAGLQFSGQRIALPPKERELLEFLLRSQGRTVSKDAVVQAVWNGGIASDESIARVVYRLRLAMQAAGGPPVVSTVYNGGFRLTAAVQWQPATGPALDGDPVGEPDRSRNGLLPALMGASRDFAARATVGDLNQALRAAAAAAALAPDKPSVWVGLAELYVQQAVRGFGAPRLAGQRALDAAERALALHPECPSALAVRGWVRGLIARDLKAGTDDLDRALRGDESCWLISGLRAPVMQAVGAHTEAIAMARQVRALNPQGLYGVDLLPTQLLLAGQVDAALLCAGEILGQFPTVVAAHTALALAWSAQGALDESLRVVEHALGRGLNAPALQGQRAYVLARKGRIAEARNALSLMDVPGAERAPAAQVVAHLALGQTQAALACWLQAKADGAPQYFTIFADPRLAAVAQKTDYLWMEQA